MSTGMFIKFEGPAIAGAATAAGHQGDIEIISMVHGTIRPHADEQNFTFTKYMDSSSQTLLQLCWSGSPIAKATVSCYRFDGTSERNVKYLVVAMQNVVIGNYSVTGMGDVPVETFVLECGSIQYTYVQPKSDDEPPPAPDWTDRGRT